MKKVQGNDCFQRMNYLYQISKYISEKNPALSSYYGNLIYSLAKKNVLKIHPEIKRQICKKCKCMLVPNVTAKVKICNINNRKFVQWHCNTCGAKRKLPSPKDSNYTLWLDRPEAVYEVINE